MFCPKVCKQILEKSAVSESKVLRIQTCQEMKVFDLMTGGKDGGEYINQMTSSSDDDVDCSQFKHTNCPKSMKAKLEEYGDSKLRYEDIAMPEIEVIVYFGCHGYIGMRVY